MFTNKKRLIAVVGMMTLLVVAVTALVPNSDDIAAAQGIDYANYDLAFSVIDNDAFTIATYIATADGSSVEQLTSGSENFLTTAWLPDYSGFLGLSIDIEAQRLDFALLTNDGINPIEIDGYETSFDFPILSPDGTRFAVTVESIESDEDEDCDGLLTANIDGSDPQIIAIECGGYYFDAGKAWSPDGNYIAYSQGQPLFVSSYVVVVPTNGEGTPAFSAQARSFTWSSDSSQFAYVANGGPGRIISDNPEIFAVNVDGGDPRMLTVDEEVADDEDPIYYGNLTWSPDGSQLAFVSDLDGSPDIYVMDNDGSNITRLLEAPGEEGSLAWSPDGMYIAFSSTIDENEDGETDDDNADLFVVNADGSNLVQLTDSDLDAGNALWRPLDN